MGFNGLDLNLWNLSRLSEAKTHTITPENPTGAHGMAAMAEPGEKHPARGLGVGWKARPMIHIEPGETATLADIRGMGAIQSCWFAGYVGRDFILRIYWDDQEIPSVECPFSDFFAHGWLKSDAGIHKGPFGQISSLPVVVNPNKGMNAFWQMPFRTRARITLENRGAEVRACYYQWNYSLSEVPKDCAYFHAQFRRTSPIAKGGLHTVLDGVQGRGHYVGTALSVGLNGSNGWWGEGEVKMYLDGDRDFPSYCSTGLEDYFCGAYDWNVDGQYTTYTAPYMGMHYVWQPDGLYTSQQRFSMYRWHLVDPIRFDERIRVTMMALGVRSGGRFLQREDDYATVAYWYQTLPTASFPQLPDADAVEVI